MAQFPKVNPVFDGNSFSTFGKQPDYIELNFGTTNGNILSAQNLGPNGAWPIIIQQIEQLATIEVLGKLTANCVLLSQNGGNANVGVRMLVTGANAAPQVQLQSAMQALGTIVIGNSTVGFSNVAAPTITVAAVTVGDAEPGQTTLGGQTSTFVF